MKIRAYRPGDADGLAHVFYRAVREGALGAYTSAQVAAWSPKPPKGAAWAQRLSTVRTFVADENGTPIGFMTLDDDGYIDLAFVLPEHMGRGVGASLYARLEDHASTHAMPRLTTQASLLAEPFFLRRAWSVTKRQTITRHGVELPNAWMAKPLASA